MPANVETMAYASNRGIPWHRQGEGFAPGEVTNWSQMREKAGLTWEVETEPVYFMQQFGKEVPVEIPGFKNVYRNDTHATLQVAKDSYHVITNDSLGDILEALYTVGNSPSGTGLDWDTAGSLNGGKRVFVTAKLGDDYEIPGDPSPIRRFLAVTNSHDGTAACRGIQVDTRIVCANTWHSADIESRRTKQGFSFRHHGNWENRLEDAKAAIFGRDGVLKASDTTRDAATRLAAITFTDDQYYELAERLCPIPDKDEHGNAAKKSAIDAAVRTQESFMFVASGANPNLEGIRNSVWGAINAAGEWLDHYKTWREEDTYITRTLIDANNTKMLAQKIALDLAHSGDGRKVKVAVPA